jgi:hypothetical protein
MGASPVLLRSASGEARGRQPKSRRGGGIGSAPIGACYAISPGGKLATQQRRVGARRSGCLGRLGSAVGAGWCTASVRLAHPYRASSDPLAT